MVNESIPTRFQRACGREPGRVGTQHKRNPANPFLRDSSEVLRLFGAWILQAVAARAHIPEIPTDKVALEIIVVEHG